jgi:hypothetical protein
MRSGSRPFDAPSRVAQHLPALDDFTRAPVSESIVVSELQTHFAGLPTAMAEFGHEELDAIVVAGRKLLRRRRILTFAVLTVLAPPVAAAGLLAGMSL